MANYEVQIKPTGLSQRNLVDVLYMIVASIYGICAKLDADATVPEGGGSGTPEYVSLCYTAIFNGYIEDSKGNTIMNRVAAKDKHFYHITPTGLTPAAFNALLYDIFDMVETLTEKLDADVLTDSNYEALVYTAYFLWMVTNGSGNTLGNGNTYWFNPGGMGDRKEIVDMLANILYAFDVFTKKLDADGTVTDTTYHALWDTAVFLMQIQDSKGNVRGNALTKFMP